MNEFDIKKLLDTPIEAFDFQFMIGHVKDFLEFSEKNIDRQYRRELQAITYRKDSDENLPPEYRDHLEQNLTHRFKVSLPLCARYGALLSFTTSVEWAVTLLNNRSKSPAPKKEIKDKTNLTVYMLRHLSSCACVDLRSLMDDYEALVHIRNCIVHSAGVVSTSIFKKDLHDAVARIEGILIGNWHYFGDHICIKRDALESPINQTALLVVELHTKMEEQGLLK